MSSGLTINTNLASSRAQRRLAQTTADLQGVFQRLSSGLRINKASDDAAGLAIASSLSADSRVYSQGVRNLNDGVSALDIASGALTQLGTITTRLKELAEEAANGTLSLQQRKPLDAEANTLISEYNRIISTTKYNSQNLLDGSISSFRLQNGYGDNGSLQLSVGSNIQRNVIDFDQVGPINLIPNTTPAIQITSGDVNGDGLVDLVTSDYGPAMTGTSVDVALGNGDGTFRAIKNFFTGTAPFGATIGDFNSDGKQDLLVASEGTTSVGLLLGNGDGTFRARVSIVQGTYAPAVGDFNGDGILDFTTNGPTFNSVLTMLGNGNGTFRAISAPVATTNTLVLQKAYDLNADGNLDVVGLTGNVAEISVLLGKGDGTFQAEKTFASGNGTTSADFGDLNHDGYVDMVSANLASGSLGIYYGNGDGTFKSPSILASSNLRDVHMVDFTGDGNLDIVGVSQDAVLTIWAGDGAGGIFAGTTPYGTVPTGIALADTNRDGVLDVLTADLGAGYSISVVSGTKKTSDLQKISLLTKRDALDSFAVIDDAMRRINLETGNIGSAQSRIETATAVLRQTTENYDAAKSRIQDADVAEDSSTLVRTNILQQAGAAVLAQANLQPSLALQLLQSAR